MDMNANRGGPDDHNCGSYCAPDDLPPPYPHNEEQSNQPQYGNCIILILSMSLL